MRPTDHLCARGRPHRTRPAEAAPCCGLTSHTPRGLSGRALPYLIVGLMIVLAATAALLTLSRRHNGGAADSSHAVAMAGHALYSTYQFGEDSTVIDIGTQPLFAPTGLITEAMKRDAILARALAEEGLEVRFHPFLKGADLNTYLQRGELEACYVGDMPALTAAASSNVYIAALAQLGFCSIVADRPMLVKELRGKRIGYPFGSNAHYVLLQAMAAADITESDVDLVQMEVHQLADALDKGRIDAFTAWEPAVTAALVRCPDMTVMHRSAGSGYLYLSRSFVDEYPKAVRHIVASHARALAWMRHHPENVRQACRWMMLIEQRLTGRPSTLTVDQHVEIAMNDLLGIAPSAAMPQSDLDVGGRLYREFQFLQDLRKIPPTVDWQQARACFDGGILNEVLRCRQDYQLHVYEYVEVKDDDDGGE